MGILPCHPQLSSAAGIQFPRVGTAAGGFLRPWDFIAHEAVSLGNRAQSVQERSLLVT